MKFKTKIQERNKTTKYKLKRTRGTKVYSSVAQFVMIPKNEEFRKGEKVEVVIKRSDEV